MADELKSCQCRAESSVAAAKEATTLTTSLHAIVQHMREDLSVSLVRIAELESKDETSRDTIHNLKKEVRLKGVEASSFQSRVGELEKESAKLMMQLDAANLTKEVMARELCDTKEREVSVALKLEDAMKERRRTEKEGRREMEALREVNSEEVQVL